MRNKKCYFFRAHSYGIYENTFISTIESVQVHNISLLLLALSNFSHNLSYHKFDLNHENEISRFFISKFEKK